MWLFLNIMHLFQYCVVCYGTHALLSVKRRGGVVVLGWEGVIEVGIMNVLLGDGSYWCKKKQRQKVV